MNATTVAIAIGHRLRLVQAAAMAAIVTVVLVNGFNGALTNTVAVGAAVVVVAALFVKVGVHDRQRCARCDRRV